MVARKTKNKLPWRSSCLFWRWLRGGRKRVVRPNGVLARGGGIRLGWVLPEEVGVMGGNLLSEREAGDGGEGMRVG